MKVPVLEKESPRATGQLQLGEDKEHELCFKENKIYIQYFLLPTQIFCPLYQVNGRDAKSNSLVHENNADYLKVRYKCMKIALSLQQDGGKREKTRARYYTYVGLQKKKLGPCRWRIHQK